MSLQLNHNRHNTSKEKDELGVHHSHHHISKDMDEHWTWCPPQYSPHFKRKVTRPLLKTRMILISWCMEGNDQSKPVCIWNRDIRIVLTTTQAAIIQTKARTNHTNIRKQRSYKFYTDARIAIRRTYARHIKNVGFHTSFVKSSTVCQNGARLSVQTSDPIFDHRLFNSTYWARLIFCHLFFTYRCFSCLGQGARLVYELNLSKYIHICGLDFLFQQGYDS